MFCVLCVLASACSTDPQDEADPAATAEPRTTTSESVSSTDDVGGDDDDGGDGDGAAEGGEDGAVTTDPSVSGPLASMLVYVADSSANRRQLFIDDYEAGLAAAGVLWPATGDLDQSIDVFRELTFDGEPPIFMTAAAFGDRPIEFDEWRTQFGFSVAETQRSLSTGQAPGTLSIFDTDRADEEIESALRADPVWSADLGEAADDDGGYFVWGDDPLAIVRERTSGPRPLGRGGALALAGDGLVIRSVDPAVVEQSLAASVGEGRSLFDDEGYLAVANALDGAGVYSAFLTSENYGVDPFFLLDPTDAGSLTIEEIEETLENITTIPPYLALGIGTNVDSGTDPPGVLVLAFAATSPETAEETVVAIEEIVADGASIASESRWSEMLTVSSTSVDGSVAIVELRTEQPRIGVSAFLQRDTLFVSS